MRAVAALAAAVGLIVAAILTRDALDDDGDSAGGTSAGSGTSGAPVGAKRASGAVATEASPARSGPEVMSSTAVSLRS